MGIRMVRQPSQTPNVTNIDDIIPFRYAYGDQNGYVIGKGTEISHTIQGNTFRINSGRVVLQGVETDIDANGVSFTIDNSSETRYFVVYYEVNLATQTTAIKLSDYSIEGYPTIDDGDDLTVNSSGIARTELYRFVVTNSVISNVEKTAKAIEYSGTALVGYDISKGTVEERLTRLGFKQGTLVLGSGFTTSPQASVDKNEIIRTGNRVSFMFKWGGFADDFFIHGTTDSVSSKFSIELPQEFLPTRNVQGFAVIFGLDDSLNNRVDNRTLVVYQDGKVEINMYLNTSITTVSSIILAIQYEAKPL